MAGMPVVGSMHTGGEQSDRLDLQRLTLEGACALTPKVVASQAMDVKPHMEDSTEMIENVELPTPLELAPKRQLWCQSCQYRL
eukprot:9522713-Karenia_brevis.AAC.1